MDRRSFLRSLGALGAGLIIAPVIEPLIVPERKKIWVVGARLESPPALITTRWTQDGWVIAASDIGSEEQALVGQIEEMVHQDTAELLHKVMREMVLKRGGAFGVKL